jgi:CRP-like cAMP-binding protein
VSDHHRKTERYERVPIFAMLSPVETTRLLQSTEEVVAEPGTVLFRRGDPCDGFYIVLAGKIEVRKPGVNGEDVPVAVLSTRSIFGEMSLLADRPRSATAVVVEQARLARMPKKSFDDLIAQGDICAYKVIHSLSKIIVERLRRTEDEFLVTLRELGLEKQQTKLAELQAFRQKVFTEWSF